MRLIDADTLAEEIENMRITIGGHNIFPKETKDSVLALIQDAATVGSTPTLHGSWEIIFNKSFKASIDYACSICKKEPVKEFTNYCPNCGARMDVSCT